MRRTCLILVVLDATAVAGCRTEQGDADSGATGGSDSGADGTTDFDACAVIEAQVVDCEVKQYEAQAAEQIPACNGGALAGEATPPEGFEWAAPWPSAVTETNPSLVGAWSEVITTEIPMGEDSSFHVPIHSVHRPTGKFLQFGADSPVESGVPLFATDKVVWYPPEPCIDPMLGCDDTFDAFPVTAEVESHVHVNQEGEDPDMRDFNLFCAAHVNLPPLDLADPEELSELEEPRTMTVGGSAPLNVNQGSPEVFLFRESMEATNPDAVVEAEWVQVDGISNSRWYATATVMPDGDVVVPGGTFNAAGGRRCLRPVDPNEPEVASPMLLRDDECMCEQVANDFFHEIGLCLAEGVCDPDGEPNIDLPYDPCWTAEDGTISGVEIAHREGPDDVSFSLVGEGLLFGVYPHLFVLPDLPHFASTGTNLGGKVAFVGQEAWPVTSPALIWDPTQPDAPLLPIGGPSCTRGSSSVMYASDKILKFGGTLSFEESELQTSRMTEILDLSGDCPIWRRRPGSEMAMPRHYSGGVLLPDGNVFAAGGTLSRGRAGDVDVEEPGDPDPNERHYTAFTAELFDGSSESWCRLADIPSQPSDDFPIFRGYHAQSFLLADGRVYLGASTNFSEETTHHNYQLFAPPYLFLGERPEIAPDVGATTQNDITVFHAGGGPVIFNRGNEVAIDKVTLVKLSASTHQWDMEQRFVELGWSYSGLDDASIAVEPPETTCYATPGYYMLFAISSLGVPSLARYVAVDGDCAAAAEPAVPPEYPDSAPVGVNDLRAQGAPGLRASCGGVGSSLGLADFRRSLLDLCAATAACPTTGEVDLEVRFISTTGQANAASQELLDSLTFELHDGVPTAVDDIAISVAGTEFTTAVDLGPGEHVLAVCGAFGLLSACIDQPLRIDPVLAEDLAADYRAGEIESRALDLTELAPGPGLALGDDDVVAVALPDGFDFPYFDETVDTIWVGANGGIRITAGDIPASNMGLPASLAPDIAVYWDDLDPTLGGRVVTWWDRDRFVVAWEGIAVAAGGRIHVQAHLFRDGRIELHYPGVSWGPSAHGASATIGVQHDGDGLDLSDDSSDLLAETRAVALDRTSCIASALRLPDSTPCRDRPVVEAVDVHICAASARATFAAPPVPTVCDAHRAGAVLGEFLLGGERQPVAQDGSVEVFPGVYEVTWQTHEPVLGVYPTEQRAAVGQVAPQVVSVTLTDDEAVCCRADQTLTVLTSGNDGPMNACASGACCLIALAGNDNVSVGAGNDTLLGRDGVDTFNGGNGHDVVVGGLGGDWLAGGLGDDTLLGGEGNDSMVGDPGDDVLHGGSGDDSLHGKDDDDEIWGGTGDDLIQEGTYTGADVALPGAGIDEVHTGAGDDHIVVLDLCEVGSGEVLDGGSGNDTLWLPAGVVSGDLTALGVTLQGIETVSTLQGAPWGGSECAA